MRQRLIITLLSALAIGSPAAASGSRIAVVAPDSGPLAILGDQVRAGARFAAAARGSELIEIGEHCGDTGDDQLARSVISAGADVAIGFLCTEDLRAALPALADADVPAITLSARSRVLMEDALRYDWPLFRLAPAPGMEADKAVDVIATGWAAEPFALIDDGTIHARELVEAIRLKLEERGMKPVFVDTFRPAQEQQIGLVRRLAKTGATHVFVGGDRGDVAVIARDARIETLPLSFMGGEALMAADQHVPLPDGTQAILVPVDGVTAEGAALAGRMKDAGIVAEGYVFPAHAAVTLVEMAKAAFPQQSITQALVQDSFPTVLGTIGFGAGHELRDNPYHLMEWWKDRFIPVPAPGEND